MLPILFIYIIFINIYAIHFQIILLFIHYFHILLYYLHLLMTIGSSITYEGHTFKFVIVLFWILEYPSDGNMILLTVPLDSPVAAILAPGFISIIESLFEFMHHSSLDTIDSLLFYSFRISHGGSISSPLLLYGNFFHGTCFSPLSTILIIISILALLNY